MAEGINMDRKCPWSKDELVKTYQKIDLYTKAVTVETLATEGQEAAAEAMGAYAMFKFPVIYLFVHYHYGKFEDIGMSSDEITNHLMLMMFPKDIAKGIIEGLECKRVFTKDRSGILDTTLLKMSEEVLFIEENY